MERAEKLKDRYKRIESVVVTPYEPFARNPIVDSATGRPIGMSSTDNTPNQTRELAFALALSDHPIVDEIISNSKAVRLSDEEEIYTCTKKPEELEGLLKSLPQSQVLRGMKIFDLGCGYDPIFSHVARNFGASEVYTVDIVPFDKLYGSGDHEEARDFHITMDLRHPDALRLLREKTKGDFDLVASASIHEMSAFADDAGRAAPPYHLNNLALALAKDNGVYFCAEYLYDPEILIKDPSVDYDKNDEEAIPHDHARKFSRFL